MLLEKSVQRVFLFSQPFPDFAQADAVTYHIGIPESFRLDEKTFPYVRQLMVDSPILAHHQKRISFYPKETFGLRTEQKVKTERLNVKKYFCPT